MCGIIGYIGPKDVVPVLIDGLRRLEYRGYDSAGVAVVRDGCVDLRRSAGKLSNLETVIGSAPLTGDYRATTTTMRRPLPAPNTVPLLSCYYFSYDLSFKIHFVL